MKKIIYSCLVLFIIACSSSSNGDVNVNPDNFNRKEMLTFWADQMIIPSYQDFETKTNLLKDAVNTFVNDVTEANLTAARNAWKNAYVSWQKVSLFQVGKAQEVNMVGSMNTIPVSVTQLNSYATSGTYNLESPNLLAVQGFPALDYLLNGQGTDAETVTFYATATNAGKYKTYLNDVAIRVHTLTKSVYDDWKGSYRQTFIDSDGYSISSSVDKLVNFYVIPFYEKQLRDPKIANPSGAKTGIPDVKLVEAYYKKDISKELFTTALTATKNFFKGVGYNGNTGKSLQQYLEFLKRKDLADLINTKFDDIEQKATALDNDFASQIQSNKIVFLSTYDSLQSLLKSFKPDMMSAMSIKNTSTDADND
ncbi:imelysin family protein [uncultured Tenacibaculum sp.]|uniref:imelysin family protein n=1 Tax=uncultured Tenacibaculum sp. TaxID=174713 RepID=UPI0026249BEB|nr:imelysin family protein [uncultured Tenacibaculum sp.]